METRQLSRQLGKILLTWSISSGVVGAVLLFVPIGLLQGIGLQALLWGIIDAVIAVFGVFRVKEQTAAMAAKFLRINVYLDVVYQLVGILLVIFMWIDAFLFGNGIGIILQGVFLFVLDLHFYRRFKVMA
ncbi:MAG: DUF6992 family protein [Candidatus Hodarchaeota archaeon]